MPRRILIFEDDPIMGAFLEVVIRNAGYPVIGLHNSADNAVELCREHKPALVLMDVNLAGEKSGLEAAEALKRAYPVPLIFLTGHTDLPTFHKAKAYNPIGFLFKPTNERQLISTLDLSFQTIDALKRLRDSEGRIRAFFDGATSGILLVEKEQSTIVEINREGAALLGLSPTEASGKSLVEVLALPTAFLLEKEGTSHLVSWQQGAGPLRYYRCSLRARLHSGPQELVQIVLEDVTDTRERNDQIQLLLSAINQTADCVIITDARLENPGPVIQFVNPAFCKMTGYEAGEVIGKTPRMLQGPETHRDVIRRLRANLRSGEPFQGETFNYRKDGTRYEVEWSVTPLKDENGVTTHYVSVQRDITSRKAIEKELVRKESQLRSIFDSTVQAYFLIDPTFRILAFNRVAADRIRVVWNREVKEGDDIRAYSTPDLMQHFEANVALAIDGMIVEKEIRVVYGPKLAYWFKIAYAPAYMSDGTLLGVSFSSLDITAEKTAQLALEDSYARLEGILGAAPDGVLICDQSGTIILANEMAAAMYKMTVVDMAGRLVTDMLPSFEVPQVPDGQRVSGRMETIVSQHDGAILPVEISFSSVALESQALITVFVRDISERKMAEEELKRERDLVSTVLNNSRSPIFIINERNEITFANPQAVSYFKLSNNPAKTLYEHSGGIVYRRLADGSFRMLQHSVVENPERSEGETYKMEWPDGTRHYYVANIAPLNNGYYVVSAIDFTNEYEQTILLRESEMRFRQMADAAPVLIWISDTSKKCTYFNKTWLDFTGRTFDQEYGNGWAEGVHPDDLDRCWNCYSVQFDQRMPFEMEYRLKRFDGMYRWMVDKGVPRFAPDGTFVGYIGSLMDVTDRRTAMEMLEHSRETLDATLNSMNSGVVRLDRSGRIDFLNEAALYDASIQPERAVGMLYAEFWPDPFGENGPMPKAVFPPFAALEHNETVQNRIVGLDGGDRMIWLSMSAAPMYLPDGTPDGAVVSCINISAQREAEEKVRESESRLSAILETLISGVVMVSPEGQILYANESACQILEVARDAVTGRLYQSTEWNQLDHELQPMNPQDLPLAIALIQRRSVDNVIHAIETNDGRMKWLSVNAAPVLDENGEISGAVASFLDISDQIRAEREIKEREERFRTLADNAPVMITVSDVEMQIEYMNKNWLDFLGIPGPFLQNVDIPSKVHPDDLESLLKTTADSKVTGGEFTTEIRMLRHDGEWRWLSTKTIPRLLDDGTLKGYISSTIDVTPIKETEQALHQANEQLEEKVKLRTQELEYSNLTLREQIAKRIELETEREEIRRQFESIASNITEAVYRSNRDGLLYANNAMVEMFGFDSQEELKAFPVARLYADPYDRVRFLRLLSRNNRISNIEMRMRRKDGTVITVLLSGTMEHDENREMQHIDGTMRDITHLKAAEELLIRQEAELSEAQRLAHLGNWSLAVEDGHIYWDEKHYRAHGMDSIHPMPYSAVFNSMVVPDDSGVVALAAENALLHSFSEFDIRLRQPDGFIRFIHGIIRVSKDKEGHVTGLFGVSRDRTVEKTAEMELEVARAKAEDLAKAKQQFLANMSHEIRTPINGIRGLAYLLAQSNLNSEQDSFVQAIKTSSDTLLGIVNDILDLSKIESGRIEFEKTPFSMTSLIKSITQMIEIKARDKKLPLVVDFRPDVPDTVSGDSLRLSQILTNLLDNAVKFTQTGLVSLTVAVAGQIGKKIDVRFVVKDTGIGIPPERIQSVFEMFTQSDASITRKFGGSGLGLTITKKLIESQGGSINVISEVGKGTEITVHIPFDQTDPVAERPVAGVGVETAKLAGLKVLVTDDNAINRLWVAKMLQKWGCKVLEANNGMQAFEMVQANPVDIVLMDIYMPELDGYDATRLIRNKLDKPKSAIPIIALTADVLDNQAERCREAGIDDWLGKPFNPDQLSAMMLRLTDAVAKIENEASLSLSGSPEGLIDLTNLYAVADNDREFINKLLSDFSQLNAETIDELKHSVDWKDVAHVRQFIHRIKPNLEYIGARKPLEMVGSLLKRMKNEPDLTFPDVELATKEIIKELENIRDYLSKLNV